MANFWDLISRSVANGHVGSVTGYSPSNLITTEEQREAQKEAEAERAAAWRAKQEAANAQPKETIDSWMRKNGYIKNGESGRAARQRLAQQFGIKLDGSAKMNLALWEQLKKQKAAGISVDDAAAMMRNQRSSSSQTSVPGAAPIVVSGISAVNPASLPSLQPSVPVTSTVTEESVHPAARKQGGTMDYYVKKNNLGDAIRRGAKKFIGKVGEYTDKVGDRIHGTVDDRIEATPSHLDIGRSEIYYDPDTGQLYGSGHGVDDYGNGFTTSNDTAFTYGPHGEQNIESIKRKDRFYDSEGNVYYYDPETGKWYPGYTAGIKYKKGGNIRKCNNGKQLLAKDAQGRVITKKCNC